jgi:hypothetical protein
MASSNQAGVQFYWSGPHGWFSFEQNPSAPLPGTYFLEVTNSLGCTATATTTVETLALPPMHVVLSTSRLCGEGIVTATVEDATHYSDYLWSLGSPNFGTIISGQGTATVQIDTGVPESTVAFPIFVEATYTPSGCRIASQGDIDLDARPTAAIVTASSTCPNATLTATTPTQPFVTYSWSIDNGTILRDMGPEIQYVANSSGDVILTVRVVRSDSCDTTDTAVVTVEQQPAILTQPQSTNIAAGQTTTLSVDASGSALYFVWFEGLRGDRTHPVASGPSRTYTTPPLNDTTMYWVEAQSACGAASSRNAVVSVSARRRAARH